MAPGDAQARIVSVGTGLPLAQAGRVRPLAVFGDRRAPQLPEVPTAVEQGAGRVDLGAWIGLFAPARTPDAIVSRLNVELATILQSPDAAAWAETQGLDIVGGTPASFASTLTADRRRWSDVISRLRLAND